MSDCPIGLICEYFECDRHYCQELASPWTLPFWVDPCWMLGVGILVSLPAYEWGCPNIEHIIIENDRYNAWVERIREGYWLGGWWDAIDLPYKVHPEGGILVIHHLRLAADVTFSCPWRHIPERPYQSHPECWEQFVPPVPLDCHRHPWDKRIADDGFYPPYVLVYASDFAALESEEYDYGD